MKVIKNYFVKLSKMRCVYMSSKSMFLAQVGTSGPCGDCIGARKHILSTLTVWIAQYGDCGSDLSLLILCIQIEPLAAISELD